MRRLNTLSVMRCCRGRGAALLILVAGVVLLSACAARPLRLPGPSVAWDAADGHGIFTRYAPVLVSEDPRHAFNRVGRPSVRVNRNGGQTVFVDAAHPVYYVQQTAFTTPRGRYVNLIYRVHFERVPYSLFPFHLTAGRNGGLLIIITLNEQQQPLLVTTVHTCGCYVAIVPTSHVAPDAYPADWPRDIQAVYGENLPARLDFAAPFTPEQRIVIYLRSGTHRVMDIRAVAQPLVASGFRVLPAAIEPMDALTRLPEPHGGVTSFFETSGSRRGYVRNSHKPFEFLLMSWWALDPRVGVDKDYGNAAATGTVFYTSLKPWRRRASDMGEFGAFLAYWGWRL